MRQDRLMMISFYKLNGVIAFDRTITCSKLFNYVDTHLSCLVISVLNLCNPEDIKSSTCLSMNSLYT